MRYSKIFVRYTTDELNTLTNVKTRGGIKSKTISLPKKVQEYGELEGYYSLTVEYSLDHLIIKSLDDSILLDVDINGKNSNEYIKSIVSYDWLPIDWSYSMAYFRKFFDDLDSKLFDKIEENITIFESPYLLRLWILGYTLLKIKENNNCNVENLANYFMSAVSVDVEQNESTRKKITEIAKIAYEIIKSKNSEEEDDDFCENVEINGVGYSVWKNEACAEYLFGEKFECKTNVMLNANILDKERNKQYTLTQVNISEGNFSGLVIQKTVKRIGGTAFSNLTSDVKKIKLWGFDNNHPYLTIENGVIMKREYSIGSSKKVGFEIQNVQLNKPAGKYKIPNNVVRIGESAFCNCNELKELIIPSSVVEIGFDAFCGCSALRKIIIYNNESAIKSYNDLEEEVKLSFNIPEGVEVEYREKNNVCKNLSKFLESIRKLVESLKK